MFYLTQTNFNFTVYPSGETHVAVKPDIFYNLKPTHDDIVIQWNPRSWTDLMSMIAIDENLRRNRIDVQWFVPYLPFARDDRRRTPGCANELDLALRLLKPLNPIIVDPHSYTSEILRHIPQDVVVEFYRSEMIVSPKYDVVSGPFLDNPVIVIPDAGAAHKVHIWGQGDMVQAQKLRDPHTGNLSGFYVPEFDFNGRPCIIVDDICDGGGTYIGLAAELKKQNVGPLRLAVTHGLFTKGIHPLAKVFNEIYYFHNTTDKSDTQYNTDSQLQHSRSFQDLYQFALKINGVR